MKKNKKTKIRVTTAVKVILTLILLSALIYLIRLSLEEYEKQAGALGIIVCSEDECIKTMHIHADTEYDLCGQDKVVLHRETGPLAGLHTHKEPNYLHFHDKIQLDPETRVDLYDKRRSVGESIDVFSLDPEEYCGTSDVKIRVLINGEESAEGLDYNWQDGDQIKLIYEQL